jgi:hypothetical protein
MNNCNILTKIKEELDTAEKLLAELTNTYERAIDEEGVAGKQISLFEESEIDDSLDTLVDCILNLRLDFNDLIQEYGV